MMSFLTSGVFLAVKDTVSFCTYDIKMRHNQSVKNSVSLCVSFGVIREI